MELTNTVPVSVATLKDSILKFKTNPTEIQRSIFDLQQDIFNNEIELVDATNPFIHLLQLACTMTAVNEQESIANLRKQYPSLSQEEEQLYLHMSDVDFINRFSTPAESIFTIVLNVNDVYNKLIYDSVENSYRATIPRDTTISVDNYVFTLQFPIDIRKYDNGIVEISYDTTIDSPLQILTTNIIDYQVRVDPDGTEWIYFQLPLKQFSISSSIISVQQSKFFSNDIVFNDNYYYCRVYYQNNNTNNLWKEILTTHTDQVFDINTPTALIKVYETQINVTIPPIYIYNGVVSGNVRIDVFTTKGNITVNFANYKIPSFELKLSPIDQKRDINDFTNAFANIAFYCYNPNIVSGGSGSLSFDDLRTKVIENSTGDRKLPITPDQIDTKITNSGFEVIKNVDVITNRIFLATRKLPKPLNSRLITAANIGIASLVANLSYLKTLTNEVADNDDRVTILSNNLFLNENSIIRIVTKDQINNLLANAKTYIINEVTSNKYLYSPFYYVLDNTQNEFEIRIYNLDDPISSNLSFISQNQTLQLPVNTGNFFLSKTSYGYELQITTKSGNLYKSIPDSQLNVQLAFTPPSEKFLAYVNGTLIGTTTSNEKIYSFRIETNHDLNSNDELILTNFNIFNNEFTKIPVELSQVFNILYSTTSLNVNYIPNDSNKLLGDFLLPIGSACITHETINLKFGDNLKNLWSRSKSLANGFSYQIYDTDIPLLYTETVYEVDSNTNSIFTFDTNGNIVYNILHNVGDPVLDLDNNPIFKHKKGDPILDANDNPIINNGLRIDREIDMLFVDGKYYFSNDPAFVSYKTELRQIINNWIVQEISSIQDILLEQTKIYFYPKTSLGMVKIFPNGGLEKSIESGQSFIVDLYVRADVYNSNSVRQQMINTIIKIIDGYMDGININITDLRNIILQNVGSSISSIEISGLGGINNYSIVKLVDEHNRLSLNKKLVLQQDGTFIINEDVTINFINIEI